MEEPRRLAVEDEPGDVIHVEDVVAELVELVAELVELVELVALAKPTLGEMMLREKS